MYVNTHTHAIDLLSLENPDESTECTERMGMGLHILATVAPLHRRLFHLLHSPALTAHRPVMQEAAPRTPTGGCRAAALLAPVCKLQGHRGAGLEGPAGPPASLGRDLFFQPTAPSPSPAPPEASSPKASKCPKNTQTAGVSMGMAIRLHWFP